jgi:hypothetical protein
LRGVGREPRRFAEGRPREQSAEATQLGLIYIEEQVIKLATGTNKEIIDVVNNIIGRTDAIAARYLPSGGIITGLFT